MNKYDFEFEPIEKNEDKENYDFAFEPIQSETSKKKEKQPFYKSIPKDILKGLLEASSKIGRMMGPLQEETVSEYRKTESQRQKELSEGLNKILPSDETFAGSTLRRALNVGGPAMAFPGGATMGMASRSGLAGLLGQTLQDVGAPEGLQTAAEIGAFLAPGLGKKIPETKSQKEIVKFLRSMGAKEEEIAPLLQGERKGLLGMKKPSKEQVLSKFAKKGTKSSKALQQTKAHLDTVFENLRTRPEANKVLSSNEASMFISNLEEKLADMPSKVKNIIVEDFEQFKRGPQDAKSMIKFWRDINASISRNPQLGTLKQPLREAIKKVDTELYGDFDLTNKLYQKYLSISKKLKPKLSDELVNFSEIGGLLYGITTGNMGVISSVVGEHTARSLATELLINPRLQNLNKRMVNALNQGKFAIANKIKDQISSELEEELPVFANKIKDFNFEQIEE